MHSQMIWGLNNPGFSAKTGCGRRVVSRALCTVAFCARAFGIGLFGARALCTVAFCPGAFCARAFGIGLFGERTFCESEDKTNIETKALNIC